MFEILVRNWGWVALRGVAALSFGLATLVVRDISVIGLSYLFGAFALAYGLMTVVAVMAKRREDPMAITLLINGVISALIGILAIVQPGIVGETVHLFVAGWCIAVGVLEVIASFRWKQAAEAGWMILMNMAGALSIGFGLLLLLFHNIVVGALSLWISVYAVVFGGLMILLGLVLRKRLLNIDISGTSPS